MKRIFFLLSMQIFIDKLKWLIYDRNKPLALQPNARVDSADSTQNIHH